MAQEWFKTFEEEDKTGKSIVYFIKQWLVKNQEKYFRIVLILFMKKLIL